MDVLGDRKIMKRKQGIKRQEEVSGYMPWDFCCMGKFSDIWLENF